jgi:ADP-ribose pyrophosphatase
VIWEVPAGRLDPGEEPEVCARRELLEEAGYVAGRLRLLTTLYTTPGFTDERIHLFVAGELAEDRHRREPDEFLETVQLRLSRALEMVASGEVSDGKTIAALLFFSRFGLVV